MTNGIREPFERASKRIDDLTGTRADRDSLSTDLYIHGQTLNSIDGQFGNTIDAHGIAKGTAQEQLKSLNHILSNGIDPNRDFSSAPLTLKDPTAGSAFGTGGGVAYRDGLFIIISDPEKSLKHDGLAAILVNSVANDIIHDLEEQFPDRVFVSYEDIGNYFFHRGFIDEETCTAIQADIARSKMERDKILEEAVQNVSTTSHLNEDAPELPLPPEVIILDVDG